MKRAALFCITFCLLITLLTPFASANTASQIQQLSTSYGIDSDKALLGSKQLVDNVKAAFLYECNSGTLMYAWKADEQLYPASLVKIMTALMALERGNLSDVVTVKESTIETVPKKAVSANLVAEEQISLESLLYCLLVGSANDAASVIAEHISGSQEAFVNEMNAYAKQLGCTKTNFTNPHGLHNENQKTTARDMAKILSAAMKNEAFRKVFSTVRCTVPATNKSEERALATGNFLMNTDSLDIYYDKRVTGGRTGVTEDGRRCLAASATGNGMELISIVMGAESVLEDDGHTTTVYGGYKEATTLFDKGFKGYKTAQVLYPEQTVDQCGVINGANDVILGSKTTVYAVLPSKVNLKDLTFRYANNSEIRAPILAGDAITTVEVWYENTCVANATLYAMNSVKDASKEIATIEVDDDGDTAQTILLLIAIAVGIILIFVVAVRIVPRVRRLMRKRRLRKYRSNRRRSR